MTIENIKRRDVLRSMNIAGMVGLTTNIATANEQNSQKITSQSILEIGIRFDTKEEYSYEGFYSEGLLPFYLEENNAVLLESIANNRIIQKFKSSSPIISGNTIKNTPTKRVLPREVDALPIKLDSRNRPSRFYSLEKPEILPTVHVSFNNTEYHVQAKGKQMTIPAGQSRSIKLPKKETSIITSTLTDEIVEVSGVPEREWGPRQKTGTAKVDVVPKIKATNHGEMNVIKRRLGDSTS